MAFDGSLWGRRVQATGQSPVATATGFVALFTLDNFQGTRNEIVNGGANSALNGGGDIRVSTDDAGANQLPLEIVQFTVSATPSLQAIQFWVRFPTYEAASRAVWVFYNRAGQTQPPVTDTFGRNAVWQDLDYVFHGEQSSITVDSSGNYALTENGTTVYTTGQIGQGVEQNTFANRLITTFNGYTGGSTRHHCLWAKIEGNDDNIFVEYGSDGTGLRFTIKEFSNAFRVEIQGSFAYTSSTFNDGEWHRLDVIQTGSTFPNGLSVYVDGTLRSLVTGSNIGINTGSNLLTFGNNPNSFSGSERRNGPWDEQRGSSSIQNANDILLTYNNQNSPSTFWTMGEPEDTGGAGTITVTESLKNVSYTPFNPVVTLTGGILVNEQLNSVSYSGLNPTIVLTGVVSVVEQLKNTQYQANNPVIDLTGSVDIVEKLSPINYSSINPSVTLTPSPIEITESLSEVSFVSRNPSILLTPEPIGIVSTVVFNGVLLDLSFDGDIKNTFFNGKIKGIEFNGSLSDLEFNGTITSKDVNGTIK